MKAGPVRPFVRMEKRFSVTSLERPDSTWQGWDKWLQRLSHFSQFGLFLFTVGTIYFTVIPLYQKALLDEAIAKKEIDLNMATQALASKEKALESTQLQLKKTANELTRADAELQQVQLQAYRQRRNFELKSFVDFYGAECSGMFLIEPMTSADVQAIRRPYFEVALEFSPSQCLTKAFAKSPLRSALQPSDLTRFESELARTATKIQELKRKNIENLERLEAVAKSDPSILAPPGAFEARADAFLNRADQALRNGRPVDPIAQEAKRLKDFQRAIVRTKDAFTRKYLDEVLKHIRGLGRESFTQQQAR